MKDSRDIAKSDQNKALAVISESKATKIIITHGTYTIADTARFIETNNKRSDQTIILTGSFVPMNGFTLSDGGFNIGFALGVIDFIGVGVYVAMHGRVFGTSEVVKFAREGKFESILL